MIKLSGSEVAEIIHLFSVKSDGKIIAINVYSYQIFCECWESWNVTNLNIENGGDFGISKIRNK